MQSTPEKSVRPGTTPQPELASAQERADALRPAFTPGPWFWATDKHNQPTSLRQSGSGHSVIHPQADVGDYGLSINPWNDVSEADARLIAAAPELLQELKWCFMGAGDMARMAAVIAKAEGQ